MFRDEVINEVIGMIPQACASLALMDCIGTLRQAVEGFVECPTCVPVCPTCVPIPCATCLLPPTSAVAGITPAGQILTVTANVLQREVSDPLQDCADASRDFPAARGTSEQDAYKGAKDCDPRGRRDRFALRIAALASKSTYDGMGYVPDIILLQEVTRTNAADIVDRLTQRTGYTYELATHAEDFGAQEGLVEDTAIVYNAHSVFPSGNPKKKDMSHGSVKSKRHVLESFTEFQAVQVTGGIPPTGLPVIPGTLNRQYVDGADYKRGYRIDHLFARGVDTYIAASYDLSCGIDSGAPDLRQNCAWLRSQDRYADHRLVWALLGVNPKPSQDLVEP
jgi:hypothetical protein